MLKTMKVLLLAGVLGGLAASPTLAQNAGRGGGSSHSMGGGGHGMGGGGAIYPRMGGGGGGHSYSGSVRSFGGPSGVYMRRGGDFSRHGMGFENRRMRALAQPGGDFPRERFRRGDRGRFVGDNDFRRFDRSRFDRRHGRFDDDGRHHRRFRNRTGAFIFFNNGWWYDEPWWTYDTAYVSGGYGDAHVQWCIDHYRSYNPANNTFVSYGGDVRECVSPYGP
jgi:BA14K-like protein